MTLIMNVSHLIKKKSYEKVEYVLRRHLITFVPQIIFFVVLVVIPVALYFMIINIFPALLENEVLYVVAILLGSIYYLSILLFAFSHFIDFYLDVWVVTNDRVVDVEQFGLFSRTISELDLFRIQDVTTDVHGVFASLFQYGKLTITTASTNVSLVFRDIPNPNKIRQELLRLAHEDFKHHRGAT